MTEKQSFMYVNLLNLQEMLLVHLKLSIKLNNIALYLWHLNNLPCKYRICYYTLFWLKTDYKQFSKPKTRKNIKISHWLVLCLNYIFTQNTYYTFIRIHRIDVPYTIKFHQITVSKYSIFSELVKYFLLYHFLNLYQHIVWHI